MSKDLIVLSDYPQASGVYWFVNNNEIIYIGSSKNIYNRMVVHKTAIKKGSEHGYKQDFYQFLQSNQFEVQYQLTEDYRQLEEDLINIHQPIFNANRAFTGISRNGRVAEYKKEYYQKYLKEYREEHKEEYKQYLKQYFKEHKEEHKEKVKQYDNQLCNYNGETLTLGALKKRFSRRGIEHPVLEAKKYLITSEGVQ